MPALKHGNTAFGYESTLKFFAGIPAVSAAPLPCGMVLLAANPLFRGERIGLRFYSSPAFIAFPLSLQMYFNTLARFFQEL